MESSRPDETPEIRLTPERLRDRSAAFELPAGQSALYIGSNPDLKAVYGIAQLVRSSHYILSDLMFPSSREVCFEGIRIGMTNEDGFEIAKREATSIGLVMIDQAVEGDWGEAYRAMQIGTIIYIHTIFGNHRWLQSLFQQRIGAEVIPNVGSALRKIQEATPRDIEIAHAVHEILSDTIHLIPFLCDSSQLETGLRVMAQMAMIANRDTGFKFTRESEVSPETHASNLSFFEPAAQSGATKPDSEISQSMLEILRQKVRAKAFNNPLEAKRHSDFDSRKIITAAQQLVSSIRGITEGLNPQERSAIREKLQCTRDELLRRNQIPYHEEMQAKLEECLKLLS